MRAAADRAAAESALRLAPSRMKDGLSGSLVLATVGPLKAWARANGIPEQVLFPPPHLARYAGMYGSSECWQSLIGVQHDEKDIYRTEGAGGIQDWGDGNAQQLLDRLATTRAAVATGLKELRRLPAGAQLDLAQYTPRAAELCNALKLLQEYQEAVDGRITLVEAKTTKLIAKQGRLGAGQAAQHASIDKYVSFNRDWCGRVSSVKARTAALRGAVSALPATPQYEHSSTFMAPLFEDADVLLEKAFALSQVPASKLLAVVYASIFQCSPWCVGSIYFTVDDAKVWQIREAVYRSMVDAYDRGLLPTFIGADKAFMPAAHWDLEGYACTRTAALREIEYMAAIVPRKSGYRSVSVKHWPRTNDLKRRALELINDPRAPHITEQPWMRDFVSAQFRERWRDFLLGVGQTKLEVRLTGLDGLETMKCLPSGYETRVPIGDLLQSRRRELAEQRGLVAAGERLGRKGASICKDRLQTAGITHADAKLADLSVGKLGKHPELRRAVHRLVAAVYRMSGRDLAAAYSHVEYLVLRAGEPPVPVGKVWDRPHGIKCARMASAHAKQPSATGGGAAAAGTQAEATAGGAEEEEEEDEAAEGELFDEELAIDELAAGEEGASTTGGGDTLALKVRLAALAVLDDAKAKEYQPAFHTRVLDPTHDPQHVPTAEALFSIAAAEQMRALGHDEAADWVTLIANDYSAGDSRHFCARSRWEAKQALAARVEALHPSFGWDPGGVWHSPKTASIQGYSRVLLESWLITNNTCQFKEVAVGWEGCVLLSDRDEGSNLCESLFARCVAYQRQDKVSKRAWLRSMAKIIRQTRRQIMDPLLRRTPMFSQQNRVYKDKALSAGWRACRKQPPCVIGGFIHPGCPCGASNRHSKMVDDLMKRHASRPQKSVRHTFHTNKIESAGVVEVLDAKPDEGEAEGEAEAEAEEEAEQLDPNMDFGMHAPRLGIHKWGEPNIA